MSTTKAVLISIQPKWCELIASGKKTVEVRKTKPTLETPFKVYIYCTANKQGVNDLLEIHGTDGKIRKANSKVIGEFVCDEISEHNWLSYRGDYGVNKDFLSKVCLNYKNMREYGNEKNLYAWHISDLVIYDKPKELSEFKKPCDKKCDNCDYLDVQEIGAYGITREFKTCLNFITKPPQSWCYVERLGDVG